jgi:uncharacterized membrane protein YsdA (DUF1294 family)
LFALKIYFILITVLTFLCFGYDKGLSRKNKWRIPEQTLFFLVLFGGTIGGLVGMYTFRHKTNKTSFILIYYGILLLQITLLYYLLDFLKSFT